MSSLGKTFSRQRLRNFLIGSTILLILFTSNIYQPLYGQTTGNLTTTPTEWIKIVKPVTGQVVTSGQQVEITGMSSDGPSKDCEVSVIVNNVWPYQKATAMGPEGSDDFSKWGFVVSKDYTSLNEGHNKITSKLSCPPPLATRWYSVIVTGVSTTQTIDTTNSSIADSNSDLGPPTPIEDRQGSHKDGFDLIAAGDYGCNTVTEEVVNKMKEKNPDLVLAIGDLSEDKDPACFFDLFSNYYGKVKVAFGEHDTDSSDKEDSSSRFSQIVRYFELDQPFYSFDYQNVHFLAMSTGKDDLIPFGEGSLQYNFVANDLAQASNNKEIDWIIVYGYRPFYSSPTVHPGSLALRDLYHPLFEKYGVDLVINTHNHNYQRTYPLKFNEVSQSNPVITDKTDSNYVNPKGPIFVTVGTAGEELYELLAQDPFVVTQFKRNGFLDIHVSNNGTILRGVFYDSTNGNDGDYFTINKL